MTGHPVSGLIRTLSRALRSVKLTIIVLLLLGAASLCGTVVPQQADRSVYVNLYGAAGARIVVATGVSDVFHSWWFSVLVGYLVLGILYCSIIRLPDLVRVARDRSLRSEVDDLRAMPYHRQRGCQADSTVDVTSLLERCLTVLRENRYRIVNQGHDARVACASARKGVAGRFGPFGVHVGVLVIVLGGIATALGRFSGEIEVPQGTSVPVRGTEYSVELQDFHIEHYEGTDAAKEYVSTISLLREGRTVGGGQVKVNHPLSLGGYEFFQWRYLPTASQVTLAISHNGVTGPATEVNLPLGEPVRVGPLALTLTAKEFLSDFALTLDGVAVSRTATYANPAARVEVSRPDQTPKTLWVFSGAGAFHRSEYDGYEFRLSSYRPVAINGLRVVRDRAVPVVYAGFLLIILGSFLSCYVFHRQVWLLVDGRGACVEIHLSGGDARNMSDFRVEMDRCLDQMCPTGKDALP